MSDSLGYVNFSRNVCVDAMRSYYDFLTKFYLDEHEIIEPPEGGWPHITPDTSKHLGKTDRVIDLLRHLPYMRRPIETGCQGGPRCYFADWQWLLQPDSPNRADVRRGSEFAHVPPSVVGLTFGNRDTPISLLDTEHGIVYWEDCPGEIQFNLHNDPAFIEPVWYEPDDFPEEEIWRGSCPAWPVEDFFEILKGQFRKLNFLPLNARSVTDIYRTHAPPSDGMVEELRDIYRQHGWPDLDAYRKEECLIAVSRTLQERYPQYAEGYF